MEWWSGGVVEWWGIGGLESGMEILTALGLSNFLWQAVFSGILNSCNS
jgi:hypothetical protein